MTARKEGPDIEYDMIFVGTSMICVLEAVFHSLSGKSVLMIDRQSSIGGAWRSLELFGFHDVENAIHYFLPDPLASGFMKKVLKWNVTTDLRKYRVFPIPLLGSWKVPYDNAFGRMISVIKEGVIQGKMLSLYAIVMNAFIDFLFKSRPPSYYIEGGTPEMLRKVDLILRASDVEVRYSTSIDRIYIDSGAEVVEITVGEERTFAKTIFFSHGSRISNLAGPSGVFQIVEKLHLRPAAHLLVNDNSPSKMYECIFTADPLIKYVHDVTRNLRESAELVGRKKLFVLALQPGVMESEAVYQAIFEKLKIVGLVGKNASLAGQYWQNIYLPRLEDSDLEKLKVAFGAQVECLKTEDFARGIGLKAEKWATKIRFPAELK